MQRVCHVTSVHNTEDVRIFHKECTSLVNNGYKVFLVGQGESYSKNGVEIVGCGKKPKSRLMRMLVFTRKIYKEAKKLNCDIYHFHDPELLPYAIKMKSSGKKVIFDSHEFYSEQIRIRTYLPSFLRRVIAKMYYSLETKAAGKIDAVIIPTTKEGKTTFENRAKKVACVGNYPRLEEFPEQSRGDVRRNGMCYAGSLTTARGIMQLVEIAEKADVDLFLAGSFESDELKANVLKKNGEEKVHYKGILDREEIFRLYSSTLIGMSLGLNAGQYVKVDCFATKVYEFMAMGMPVIISDIPYHRTMMEQYDFGFCVNPEDVDDVAKKVKYLMENEEEAKRMGENGKRLVREHFSWEIAEKVMLDLYQQILSIK